MRRLDSRWFLGSLCAVIVTVGVAVGLASNHRSDPATRIDPTNFYSTAGSPTLTIGFRLPSSVKGWCVGQYTVTVTETPSRVLVGDVVEHPRGNNCLGVGSVDGIHGSVDTTLAQPVGGRQVVRASDGAILPRSTS
jgi:hypothetical protein